LDSRCAEGLHRDIRGRPPGKLRDAAVYWAGGGKRVEDKTKEDAAAFGIVLPEEPAERSNDFEVWDENWDAVMMFLRMQTQWTTTMAGYMGLRYDVLLAAGGMFDLYNVENRREMLEDLQIMEAAALSKLAKDKDG
jgi:hypothetical protein